MTKDSVHTKKEMCMIIKNITDDLYAKKKAYLDVLQEHFDKLCTSVIDIAAHHSTNIKEPYEPNEGLSGRSRYKQQNIVKSLIKLTTEYDKTRNDISVAFNVMNNHFETFIESSKYYFPDDVSEKLFVRYCIKCGISAPIIKDGNQNYCLNCHSILPPEETK